MSVEQNENGNIATLQFDATCPGCSASIEYNPAVGKMKCPYCDYETDIPVAENEEEKTAEEMAFDKAEDRGSTEWGLATKTIICHECGAETIYDALQVADSCPYCNSHQVMEANDVDTLAPNGVCPFEVTHKQAADNFHKWVKGKWFMPTAAKKSAKPERFEGLYLPYWTFDTKTSSNYSAEYGIKRKVKGKDGKEETVIDWYAVKGFYQHFIDDHLIIATKRYKSHLLKQIEPFSLKNNKVYRPEYLSGYAAERYSVGLDEGWKQAQDEIQSMLRNEIRSKILKDKGADDVRNLKISTVHDEVTYKYLTLPIWISSFKYNDRTYNFMVNGQTGKVGGESPVSALKVTTLILAIFAVIAMIILLTYQ